MRRAVEHAALCAILAVSCAPAATTTESVLTQKPHSPLAAGPPETSARTKEDQLQDRVRSALSYVSEIRSLVAKTPVKGRLISRAEIERSISIQLDDETPKDVLQASEAMLYGFGTVDEDFDYRKSVIGLMTSQLLGFYDPKQKTFFVNGDLAGDEADVTLWHELVHALQDQHYDLSHLTEWAPDSGDRQSAVHALAEGDATSAMLDAMLKPRGSTALDVPESLMQAQTVLGSAVASAPPVLVRSLLAPYVDGLAFANFLRRRGGFAAVDQSWRAPPVSTEQLLHPDKFLAREPPLAVALPPPPIHAPELIERFHDVMGEQTLRILLEEWLPARTAAAAAADWGGDRFAAFSDDARKRWALGWHLRFDSASAAERAFVAFARALPLTERTSMRALPGQAPKPAHRDRVCRPRQRNGAIAVVRRGSDLGVTVGPFERHGATVISDSDCRVALVWAETIVTH